MANNAGSIKRLDIFGISYDVVGDSEPNKKPRVEKEFKATSGQPLIDSTKMVPVFESIQTSMTQEQHDELDKAAADNQNGPLSMTNAAGKTWSDNGQIAIGDYNVKGAVADITLIPETDFALI